MSIAVKGVDNQSQDGHQCAMPSNGIAQEPTEQQVEAAARAWMTWQFPGRAWEDAVPAMKSKFRDGARLALLAAFVATLNES
jgi:hypothetical protein